MTSKDLKEQLIKYLTDAHSIECQALVQMKAAPSCGASHPAPRRRRQLGDSQRERLQALRLQAGAEGLSA